MNSRPHLRQGRISIEPLKQGARRPQRRVEKIVTLRREEVGVDEVGKRFVRPKRDLRNDHDTVEILGAVGRALDEPGLLEAEAGRQFTEPAVATPE